MAYDDMQLCRIIRCDSKTVVLCDVQFYVMVHGDGCQRVIICLKLLQFVHTYVDVMTSCDVWKCVFIL